LHIEATNLMWVARGAKYLGNGVAAIDFGSRASDIYDEYKEGGDWGRKMFVESSSFALSAATGDAVATAGMIALEDGLAIALAATPAGWVILVGGLVVVGVAAAGSIYANDIAQGHAGSFYDRIMSWMSRL
jgi:hypothetical protein